MSIHRFTSSHGSLRSLLFALCYVCVGFAVLASAEAVSKYLAGRGLVRPLLSSDVTHPAALAPEKPSPAIRALAGPAALPKPRPPAQALATGGYGRLPLSFEPNQGQTDSQVKFISRGSGYTLFLTSTEAVLSLKAGPGPKLLPLRPIGTREALSRMEDLKAERLLPRAASRLPTPGPETSHPPVDTERPTVLRMKLVGANPAPKVLGLNELPGKANYFIGNDPTKWRTNVPTYSKVCYHDIYPGVDLVYYGNQGQLEYDFGVAPGIDPGVIKLSLQSEDEASVNQQTGDLVLRVSGGEVRFNKPIVYQKFTGSAKRADDAGAAKRFIKGRYVTKGGRQIAFEVATYDSTKALVIDPILSYSTYLGGKSVDFGHGIAIDSSRNAYVTGGTQSTNFPTTPGPSRRHAATVATRMRSSLN